MILNDLFFLIACQAFHDDSVEVKTMQRFKQRAAIFSIDDFVTAILRFCTEKRLPIQVLKFKFLRSIF